AHDLYIMPSSFRPSPGQAITLGFHVGDSFPNSEVAGRIPRLVQPKLSWQGGSAPVTNLRIEGLRDLGSATTPSAPGTLTATVAPTPNFIELAPDKFLSYLKHEGLDEIIAYRASHNESDKPGRERYSKYARALLRNGAKSTPFFQQPSGLIIEIIPTADPYSLKPGDQLPVQVLFRGKPAANLHMEASWAHGSETKSVSAGRTDANGRLTVSLPKAGLWRLHTIKMERCADPSAADWESFWSSLTFELENAK
ncbi:MAG: DUF4198 domain-containing protein, partial [Bryobacterales bacterium]|nr:DUF4198 domain-containing protein [Bryobacterales bacterium]